MSKEINKDYFLALKINSKINRIEKCKISTLNEYEDRLNHLYNLSIDDSKNISDMVTYAVNKDVDFFKIEGEYKYCEYFNKPWQGVTVNVYKELSYYQSTSKKIMYDKNLSEDEKENKIKELKLSLFHQIDRWVRAYYSEIMFNKLKNGNLYFVFSHREKGWSNPEFILTKNFNVEIKTNFGYGSSSYFYTILTYKNLKIVPFSDWVEYQFAGIFEIVRYSRKHLLMNQEWVNVIDYSFNACNLSLTDEGQFVRIYIIDEIVNLINGLFKIFTDSSFSFKKDDGEREKVDINGFYLISFRGEKIVGSLDFINTLLEFKDIIPVEKYINEITQLNHKIIPILKLNLPLLIEEILKKESLLAVFDKPYEHFKNINKTLIDKFHSEMNYYVRTNLENMSQLINSYEQEDRERNKLEAYFINRNPEYNEVNKIIQEFEEKRKFLNDEVYNLNRIKFQIEKNIKLCEEYLSSQLSTIR